MKMNPKKLEKSPTQLLRTAGRAARCARVAAALVAAVFNSNAPAQLVQPFTHGNIVAERLGNGTAALTTSNCSIFFDEYTTNGAGQSAVQSIPIPSTGPTAMVDDDSTASGEMTLAASGQFLCFPGGVTNTSNPFSLGSATSAQVPRGVGTLDAYANYSLVITSSVAYSAGTQRGVASDGNGNFWASGTATTVGGIYYLGTASPSNIIYSANLRCCALFNGNLWYTTGSGTPGIGLWEFPGTPPTTAVGNTANKIFTTTSSPYNFSISPDGNTIFYADDAAGIMKLTNDAGTFNQAYVLTTKPSYGLLVDWTTTPATVYASSANGANNSIIRISDTGANAAVVTNATAGANKMFRSLAFTPTNATFVALPPIVTNITPASLTTSSGGTATFTLSGFAGNPIASNNWYEVVGATTNLISRQKGALTLSNLVAGSYSFFAILTNASGSATSSVASLTVTPNPVITAITPTLVATNPGAMVTFTLTANPGNPVASNLWFKVGGGTTNLLSDGTTGSGSVISGSTTLSLTISNVSVADETNYFAILTNSSGSATSAVASLYVSNFPPVITGIGPASITDNAGQPISFTVTNSGTAPFSYFWYQETATATNLVSATTNATLTLTNIGGGNTGNYEVVVSNLSTIAVTSSVVSLTVTNDPNIEVQPANAQGLADGTVQFAVTVAGTSPISYQWYFSDTNGNPIAPVSNGTQGDNSVNSGVTNSILAIANLQPADLTNFVVVVTDNYGSATSSVASVVSGGGGLAGSSPNPNTSGLLTSNAVLALWDFDGPQFTNFIENPNCVYFPAPLVGAGTARPVGLVFNPAPVENLANLTSTSTSPFATGANDPNDVGFDGSEGGYVFTPYGFEQPSPNGSWGTDNYPATNGINKGNGVQFNVSTAGAKNIRVAYDSRLSSTASLYERLQYTTNGTDWTDFPESSTFGVGNFGSGDAGYYTFDYNLTGIPGVDNNPNFGFRIVTEWQSTATYGIGTTNFWVGVANVYTSGASGNSAAGTVSYDLVAVIGDAITNNNTPPDFAPFNMATTNGLAYTNMVDTNALTINFSVSSLQMPASDLTLTAEPLGMITGQSAGPGFPQATVPSTINPQLAIANTGGDNFALTISFPPGQGITDPVDAAPILITATDTNGESASAWFLLTVGSINQDPTNSLTALPTTNMLANTSLTIPFMAGGVYDGYSNLTYTVASDNTTVIPVGNIVIGGNTNTGDLTLTVTPAGNQVGNAVVSVTVNDNNPAESRSTTANVAFTVLPNTNVVAVDYFNYDGGSGSPLDVVGAPYWSRFSGIFHQLQLGSGDTVVINDGNTENVQAPLIGAPYSTNSGAVLYASMTVNMSPSGLPTANGNYFVSFNDGSLNTAHVEGNLVATTNGAALGMYRLGIGNGGPNGATGANAQVFPQDLAPGVNYMVIMSLSLSNGFSTLWVSPTNQASQSVTDTTVLSPTNLYNIVNIDLRESGGSEGIISVGNLIVGTNFTGVFYPPQANPVAYSVVENTTNLLNPLPNDSGFDLSISNAIETDGNGTATSNGTNITFVPTANFVGSATFDYTIVDNLGDTNTSEITVTVTSAPTAPTDSASITAEFRSGTNLVIEGTNNNVPNTSFHYEVLSSTNIATPLSNWTPIVTNPFNADGTFDYTNPILPGTPQQYIDVKAVP